MYLPDWQHRFLNYLHEAQTSGITFDWNSIAATAPETWHLHCVSWANGGVKAVTGVDLYAKVASDLIYDGPISAYKAIKTFGVDTVEDLLAKYLAPRELAFMRMGDVAMVPIITADQNLGSPNQLACGLVAPPYIYLLDPQQGLMRVPMSEVELAFDSSSVKP